MLNEGPKMPKPEEFAGFVAESDGYEIAAAQCAVAQSRNARVRAFAQQMLTEHEHMAAALRDAAMASGLKLPQPHVGADQARFLSGLQGLRGEEFDREYSRQQMLAHTSALAVMRTYAKNGVDSNLRRLAASLAPAIEHHLEMARDLQNAVK